MSSWLRPSDLASLDTEYSMGPVWSDLQGDRQEALNSTVGARWAGLPWIKDKEPEVREDNPSGEDYRHLDGSLLMAYALHLRKIAEAASSALVVPQPDERSTSEGILYDLPDVARNILLGGGYIQYEVPPNFSPSTPVSLGGANTPGSPSGNVTLAGATLEGSVITFTRGDGSTFKLDLSGLIPRGPGGVDGVISGASLSGNNVLTITRTIGDPINVDLSVLSGTDGVVTGGILSAGVLILTRSKGSDIRVNLSELVGAAPGDGVVSAANLRGQTLVLTRTVGRDITVDLSSLASAIPGSDGTVSAVTLTGTNLKLTRTVGDPLVVDLASLADGVINGITLRGSTLTITRSVGANLTVDLSSLGGGGGGGGAGVATLKGQRIAEVRTQLSWPPGTTPTQSNWWPMRSLWFFTTQNKWIFLSESTSDFRARMLPTGTYWRQMYLPYNLDPFFRNVKDWNYKDIIDNLQVGDVIEIHPHVIGDALQKFYFRITIQEQSRAEVDDDLDKVKVTDISAPGVVDRGASIPENEYTGVVFRGQVQTLLEGLSNEDKFNIPDFTIVKFPGNTPLQVLSENVVGIRNVPDLNEDPGRILVSRNRPTNPTLRSRGYDVSDYNDYAWGRMNLLEKLGTITISADATFAAFERAAVIPSSIIPTLVGTELRIPNKYTMNPFEFVFGYLLTDMKGGFTPVFIPFGQGSNLIRMRGPASLHGSDKTIRLIYQPQATYQELKKGVGSGENVGLPNPTKLDLFMVSPKFQEVKE